MAYMRHPGKNKVSLTRLRKAFKGCKLLSFAVIDNVSVIKILVKQGIVTTFKIYPLKEGDDNALKLLLYLQNLPRAYEEINI